MALSLSPSPSLCYTKKKSSGVHPRVATLIMDVESTSRTFFFKKKVKKYVTKNEKKKYFFTHLGVGSYFVKIVVTKILSIFLFFPHHRMGGFRKCKCGCFRAFLWPKTLQYFHVR